jgi:tRNA (mo5U34)-methyltransferase
MMGMSKGPSPPEDPFGYVRDWNRRRAAIGWWHSFELPDGRLIEGVCDLEGLKNRIAQFPIPADLTGKRVLDVGAWDGWFSFEMERRGAEVLAIDCLENPRFHEMRDILGSSVDYRQIDIYDLTPDRVGRFDIVLFLGVLYHLKHPLLALERVCALTTDLAAVDSFILREEHCPGAEVESRPIMEFYETDEFGGQTDNWVGPSLPCLEAFCRAAGFARVEIRGMLAHSACLACYRRWEPPPPAASGGPELLAEAHAVNFGINFQSRCDEYVCCPFAWPASHLELDDVQPEVRGYGVRPLHLDRIDGDHWQATFKLPPGLDPGWHDVRLRTSGSGYSNSLRIAVDMPARTDRLIITGICDGVTWRPGEVALREGNSNFLSLWIDGLGENADCNNVRVRVGGKRQAIGYLSAPDARGIRQVNVRLSELEPGRYEVSADFGETESPAASLTLSRG